MTQTIKQLQAKIAELEERRCEICGYAEHHREHTGCLRTRLAAEQLNNKLLREALKMVTNKVCWSVFTDSEETQTEEALAQPSDTSALDSFVAEKVKEQVSKLVSTGNKVMEVANSERLRLYSVTKQRDLAVEALKEILVINRKKTADSASSCTTRELVEAALSAIKESEGKR